MDPGHGRRYYPHWPRLTALHVEQESEPEGMNFEDSYSPESAGAVYRYYLHPDDIVTKRNISMYSIQDHDEGSPSSKTSPCRLCFGALLLMSFGAAIAVAVVLAVIMSEPYQAYYTPTDNITSVNESFLAQKEDILEKDICKLIDVIFDIKVLSHINRKLDKCDLSLLKRDKFMIVTFAIQVDDEFIKEETDGILTTVLSNTIHIKDKLLTSFNNSDSVDKNRSTTKNFIPSKTLTASTVQDAYTTSTIHPSEIILDTQLSSSISFDDMSDFLFLNDPDHLFPLDLLLENTELYRQVIPWSSVSASASYHQDIISPNFSKSQSVKMTSMHLHSTTELFATPSITPEFINDYTSSLSLSLPRDKDIDEKQSVADKGATSMLQSIRISPTLYVDSQTFETIAHPNPKSATPVSSFEYSHESTQRASSDTESTQFSVYSSNEKIKFTNELDTSPVLKSLLNVKSNDNLNDLTITKSREITAATVIISPSQVLPSITKSSVAFHPILYQRPVTSSDTTESDAVDISETRVLSVQNSLAHNRIQSNQGLVTSGKSSDVIQNISIQSNLQKNKRTQDGHSVTQQETSSEISKTLLQDASTTSQSASLIDPTPSQSIYVNKASTYTSTYMTDVKQSASATSRSVSLIGPTSQRSSVNKESNAAFSSIFVSSINDLYPSLYNYIQPSSALDISNIHSSTFTEPIPSSHILVSSTTLASEDGKLVKQSLKYTSKTSVFDAEDFKTELLGSISEEVSFPGYSLDNTTQAMIYVEKRLNRSSVMIQNSNGTLSQSESKLIAERQMVSSLQKENSAYYFNETESDSIVKYTHILPTLVISNLSTETVSESAIPRSVSLRGPLLNINQTSPNDSNTAAETNTVLPNILLTTERAVLGDIFNTPQPITKAPMTISPSKDIPLDTHALGNLILQKDHQNVSKTTTTHQEAEMIRSTKVTQIGTTLTTREISIPNPILSGHTSDVIVPPQVSDSKKLSDPFERPQAVSVARSTTAEPRLNTFFDFRGFDTLVPANDIHLKKLESGGESEKTSTFPTNVKNTSLSKQNAKLNTPTMANKSLMSEASKVKATTPGISKQYPHTVKPAYVSNSFKTVKAISRPGSTDLDDSLTPDFDFHGFDSLVPNNDFSIKNIETTKPMEMSTHPPRSDNTKNRYLTTSERTPNTKNKLSNKKSNSTSTPAPVLEFGFGTLQLNSTEPVQTTPTSRLLKTKPVKLISPNDNLEPQTSLSSTRYASQDSKSVPPTDKLDPHTVTPPRANYETSQRSTKSLTSTSKASSLVLSSTPQPVVTPVFDFHGFDAAIHDKDPSVKNTEIVKSRTTISPIHKSGGIEKKSPSTLGNTQALKTDSFTSKVKKITTTSRPSLDTKFGFGGLNTLFPIGALQKNSVDSTLTTPSDKVPNTKSLKKMTPAPPQLNVTPFFDFRGFDSSIPENNLDVKKQETSKLVTSPPSSTSDPRTDPNFGFQRLNTLFPVNFLNIKDEGSDLSMTTQKSSGSILDGASTTAVDAESNKQSISAVSTTHKNRMPLDFGLTELNTLFPIGSLDFNHPKSSGTRKVKPTAGWLKLQNSTPLPPNHASPDLPQTSSDIHINREFTARPVVSPSTTTEPRVDPDFGLRGLNTIFPVEAELPGVDVGNSAQHNPSTAYPKLANQQQIGAQNTGGNTGQFLFDVANLGSDFFGMNTLNTIRRTGNKV